MQKVRKAASGASVERILDSEDSEEREILQVARRVAATIGTDFFRAIARHLAKTLKADCVLIGEFVGGQTERATTLGGNIDGKPVTFEYELAGSVTAQIAQGKHILCRADAQTRFPADKLLPRVRAQACLGVPLTNPEGKVLGFMMALYRRPVTALRGAKAILDIFSGRAAAELSRKHEEDDLRESEQRYRAFIARNADAMWRVEFEQPIRTDLPEEDQLDLIYRYGYLAECNDALARMVGAGKAERLIGSRVEDISPRGDPEIRDANLQAIRAGYHFTNVETTRVDQFGKRVHLLRSQWGIVEDGTLERIWGMARDITDLKQSELALDASERRLVDLLESISLAVVLVDPTGGILFCNRYLHNLTGWDQGETERKDWMSLMIPPEEHAKLRELFADAASRGDPPIRFETTIQGPDGQRWLFDWDRAVLRDADGAVTAWANLGRDVTRHRELEEHYRQSQKLASLGRVSGGVAHDFNNLLTVIMGYSSVLLDRTDSADPAYLGLAEIRKAAAKGAELTHRLLAFSRRQVLRPEVLNLNALISDAEKMLGRLIGDNIRLSSNLDPGLGLVLVDPGSFHQVIMNLAANARDAMPDGGSLTIVTSNANIAVNGEYFPKVPAGEYVQVAVTDTGVGMTAEARLHLFEPFFTTKEHGKGTGLGLSMVYGIVQQSGGRILVESGLGSGTTIRIFFPRISPDIVLAQEDRPAGEPLPGGNENILVVEDREDVLHVTSAMLSALGYSVLKARGPQQALEFSQDRSREIHLMLADVVMPETGGFELANLVKSYQPGIRVIFMSGSLSESSTAEKLAQSDFVYLQKPFTPEELARSIRDLLNPK